MARMAIAPVVALAIPAAAGNWPAWRGAEGNGICLETNLPLRWSTNENVRWRAPLPDRGNSTPIVWSDRVFVTQAVSKANRRTLMCFDRHDGKLLWQQGPTWTEKELTHANNPYCSPSPVTDGERVLAWFGSAGVYCYDFAGRELWRRDLGRQSHVWGYAASPILYGDLCILNFGPGQRSFVIALDKRTGKTVWQFDLPPIPPDAKWEDFGGNAEEWKKQGYNTVAEISGSCSTPLVIHDAERDELVVALELRVQALSPKTGEPLWRCGGHNTCAYGSPFFVDGLVVVSESGFRNCAMAIRPGGKGDVTATRRVWHFDPPNSKVCIGSGVIFQDRIYQVTAMGFAQCLDLQTGKTVWEERLNGSGARNSFWSSPVLAGDRLYVPNQNADVFVLRVGPRIECLATNSISGEMMNASLAVSDGDIFIRTHQRLWCVANISRP